MSSPVGRYVLYMHNMYVLYEYCNCFFLAGRQPLHGTGFERQYYVVQGCGRIGCRVVYTSPHEMYVIVVLIILLLVLIIFSLDIVFILLKEHYLDLGIHPQIGCIEMAPGNESLQVI